MDGSRVTPQHTQLAPAYGPIGTLSHRSPPSSGPRRSISPELLSSSDRDTENQIPTSYYGYGVHTRLDAVDSEQRALQFRARHIQMMALGSAMGTSLFIQSGKQLYFSGPVSILLASLFMGSVAYAMLISLGEMIALLPVPGGFITLANRCLTPGAGFICGWSYWFARAISVALQLTLVQSIMATWVLEEKYRYVWITIFFIILFLFNLLNVRRYGEIEFWMTVVKLLTIVGIIILGVLLPMGVSSDTRQLGTNTANNTVEQCSATLATNGCLPLPGFDYWKTGPAFRPMYHTGDLGNLIGFWAACCQAIVSYMGVEIIGIVAEETERQRDSLPSACRRIAIRGILYHLGAIFVLGLNVSSNDPILQQIATMNYASPFVLMVKRAGISVLGHIINAVTVIALLGVANTRLYVSSRTLCALAKEGQAFRIFARTGAWNVPVYSLAFSALLAVIAFAAVKTSSNLIYDIIIVLLAPGVLFTWAIICATYLRFYYAVNAQNQVSAIPPNARSPLQPYLSIYGLAMSLLLTIFFGYEVFTRGNNLWAVTGASWGRAIGPWMVIASIVFGSLGWYGYGRVVHGEWDWKVPRIMRIDLVNGRAPILEIQEGKKGNWVQRTGKWVLENL